MFQMNLKKIWLSLFLALFIFSTSSVFVLAEGEEGDDKAPARVEYQEAPIVDSDFDGLTDQGEIQIFKTDPQNQDTDGDGFYDGAEVLRGTDPLSLIDPMNLELADQIKNNMISETPWAWYVTRSAGILGFVFLWLSVFLGLSIRNNWLKILIQPIYSFDFHCFLGASALFWGFIHGGSILFDKFFGMGFQDIMIPFYFKYPGFVVGGINYLALGIIAFYAMVVLIFTSYFKKFLSQKVWRILHFLNPMAFVFVVLHGYFIGTDMKNVYIASVFVWSSILLGGLYFSNLFFVLWNNWRANHEENNETINSNQG